MGKNVGLCFTCPATTDLPYKRHFADGGTPVNICAMCHIKGLEVNRNIRRWCTVMTFLVAVYRGDATILFLLVLLNFLV